MNIDKIIKENNRVNYGVFDVPVDFNWQDYTPKSFFGKPLGSLGKKFSYHNFNYIGIITDEFLIGIATVSLGYIYDVFAYVYHYKDGILMEFDTKGLDNAKDLVFPRNPDEYTIKFEKGKNYLIINKSHSKSELSVSARLGDLDLDLTANYGLKSHLPLRVLNPSEPFRWTFTEKCSRIVPNTLKVVFNKLELKYNYATVLYDWSGGYMRRETNWYWAAMSGILPDKRNIGLNFAALVNEAYFSENAYWIERDRKRITRCIFEFDYSYPYKTWKLWDEEGNFELEFKPEGERGEKINLFFVKTDFRQFFGKFSGRMKKIKPGSKDIVIKDLYGFTEFHRALW